MQSKPPSNDEQINNIGRYMMFGMWIGLLGMLTLFFYDWQEKEFNPNTNINTQLNPQGQQELQLVANRQGQYIVNGFINSTKVTFLVDTGANDVSIPEHIARKIGLPKGRQVLFETANGSAYGYKTRLATISVGNIQLKNISASINPNVKFDEILLGMSFLKHVEINHKNNTLTLRY